MGCRKADDKTTYFRDGAFLTAQKKRKKKDESDVETDAEVKKKY
jgi:hypothetical protein